MLEQYFKCRLLYINDPFLYRTSWLPQESAIIGKIVDKTWHVDRIDFPGIPRARIPEEEESAIIDK